LNSWIPNENYTDHHLNIGTKTLFLTPDKDINLTFPVEHLVSILNKDMVKTIIQIDKDVDDIIPKLKELSTNNEILQKRVTHL
jgi:hypothetical protein